MSTIRTFWCPKGAVRIIERDTNTEVIYRYSAAHRAECEYPSIRGGGWVGFAREYEDRRALEAAALTNADRFIERLGGCLPEGDPREVVVSF